MTKPLLICAALSLAALLAGCPGPGAPAPGPSAMPPAPVDAADDMIVQTPPHAASWDGDATPDGLDVQLYFFVYRAQPPVTVQGRVEFLLYEGILQPADLPKQPPAYTWVFTGDLLRSRQARSTVGWGYAMQLGWGKNPPQTSSVTLLVKYTPNQGAPIIFSKPITIAVGPR